MEHSAAWVRAAVQRARDYAREQGVPLTAERLAAELGIHVTEFRRLVREEVSKDRKKEAVREILRGAYEEANASVVEHAMKRGTSANMHMLYLRQYAGYRDEEEKTAQPVIFSGEEEL